MSRRKHRNPFQWRKLAVLPTATCLALCMGYTSPAIAEEPVQNSEANPAQVSTVEESSPGVDATAKESPTDKSNKSALSATTIPAADASSAADESGSEAKPAPPAEDVYALVPSESSPHLTWTKNGEPCAASGWKSFEGAWYWFDGSPCAAEARWVSDRGSWYWLGEDGRMAEGTFEAQGSLWHATASGALLTGRGWAWDGAWYRTSPSGALTTGWLWDGAWYWLDPKTGKMAAGWFRDGGGDWYLADGSGRMLTGWQATGGRWYHLAGSGRMDAGWLWDGAWYWLDPESGAMAVGWAQDGAGSWWYLLGDGTLSGQRWVAGWAGSWYWVDASGRMGSGWLPWGGSWYWLDPETGKMATADWVNDRDTFYWVNADGIMASNSWVHDSDGYWHWANNSGAMASGWFTKGAAKYYLDPKDAKHPMVTGLATIDDKQYSFGPSGEMQTAAWVAIDESGFYSFAGTDGVISSVVRKDANGIIIDSEGNALSGWVELGGTRLYVDSDTHQAKTGWLKQDEGYYYLDASSGSMHTGWTHVDGYWYYLGHDGIMQTGWQSIGNAWYYLSPASGAMKTGWLSEGGAWYFLNNSGAMATGWIWDNAWYYLRQNGAMATGWIWDGSRWYFLQANGALFKINDMVWALNSFGFNGLNSFNTSRSISNGAWDELQNAINNYSNMGCTVGFTMIDLTTGAGVAYNADWRHNSASTIKGPYVVALNKLWPWELANSESDMFITLDVSSNFTYANLCNRYGHFPLDYMVSEVGAGGFAWDGDYGYYSSKDLCKMWVDVADYLINGGQNAEWLQNVMGNNSHITSRGALSWTGSTVYAKSGWVNGYVNSHNEGYLVMRGDHPYVVAIMSDNIHENSWCMANLVNAIDRAHSELVW